MVAHAIVAALFAAAPAASPEPPSAAEQPAALKVDAPERTAQQLRDAVHAALRRQSTAQQSEWEAAVRELATVYQELTLSTRLVPRERRQLGAMVRSRLMRASKALERELARNEETADPQPRDPPGPAAILAQRQPPNPAGQPNAARRPQNRAQAFGPAAQVAGAGRRLAGTTNRNAQELIDLIQNVIAPSSWDVNGGLGTIMYFAPKQVLVIRARGDIHEQVGETIEALRGK
jgi:hypothetical protein